MIRCRSEISFSITKVSSWPLALLLFIIALPAYSQIKDSMPIHLTEVIITGTSSKQFKTAKKTQLLDSLTKNNFNSTNLADLLSVNTPVFIKNYGPANLSSASLRGGNASQSPVLWNGFNIQNPMLGQNDFSQLPAFIFDQVAIEYGGSSASWGSGAMGGSIHLNNEAQFNKGFYSLITMGLGSFETKKLNTVLHYSSEKISSNTKVYYNASLNDFDFIDTVRKKQLHADYSIKGFLQELSFNTFKNQKINIRAWYNQSQRNLPSTLGNSVGKADQADENLKLTADWLYIGKKITPGIRVAYFDDVLNYTDSLTSIFSNSNTKTLIAEADVKYKINEHHQIYIGYNYTSYKAITVNYTRPQHELNKQALLAGYNLDLLDHKLVYELHIRQEHSNAFQIPLTGSTGLYYQLIKPIKLKLNASRVFRLPTLNDLYWSNGGNPNLKPEEGYTYEGGFEINLPYKQFLLQSEMTYFSKTIDNWIGWVPGAGGYPSPINIARVFSRGTETSNSITYTHKDLKCKIGFNSAYVLSNPVRSNLINDASVNKQLIYTPRYNYGANFTFTYSNFMLAYYHNYIGYRFTSSDNSSWLMPYDIANLKVAYRINLNHLGITSSFHLNNLFNSSYRVVAQRPMPLRNYEISLTLTYHKPKTKKNN